MLLFILEQTSALASALRGGAQQCSCSNRTPNCSRVFVLLRGRLRAFLRFVSGNFVSEEVRDLRRPGNEMESLEEDLLEDDCAGGKRLDCGKCGAFMINDYDACRQFSTYHIFLIFFCSLIFLFFSCENEIM